jgi:RimJ/RimL family protein N-acetyltransferase
MDALRTERLLLRRWVPADRSPFAALNADPVVMEHFPASLTRAESDTLAGRIDAHLGEHGWGLWAVELPGPTDEPGRFAGFTGLAIPAFDAHFTPAMEVGWRLAPWAWGHGYATEAASAALTFAFTRLGRGEVVSFTPTENLRSRAVMRRLGMTRDVGGDFRHPALPPDHRLSNHVLYRLAASDWRPPERRR